MRLPLGAALLIAGLTATTNAPPVRPQPGPPVAPVAITNVTVVDVVNARLIPSQTLVTRGNRIVALGPSATTRAPAGSRTVDGTGRFVIPGLWDMHAHTADSADTHGMFIPIELANGITGIRDLYGDPLALRDRDAIAAGRIPGPRMVVATPLIDGRMWPGSAAAATPGQGRALVDSFHTMGYDFVKTYEFLPRAVFLAIAQRARELHMPLAGHVPLGLTAIEASTAGMRSLEHDIGIMLTCASDASRVRAALIAEEAKLPAFSFPPHGGIMTRAESEAVPSVDLAACARLAPMFTANDTWLVPTLVLYRGLGAPAGSAVRTDPRLKYFSQGMRQFFATTPGNPGMDSLRPHMARLATTMLHAGAGVLAGTDTPNPGVIPGFDLHDELALLVEGGFTPVEALRAATINPARFFHATDSLGTVEQGKVADLVVLDANPLADIHNTTKIHAVVANGRLFTRASLDSILSAVLKTASGSAGR